MAGGLALIVTGDLFGGVWLALIGMVVNGSARGAAMQTAITSKIDSIRVADVMDREPVAIPGELSVERALDEYFLRYRWPWFPVVDAAHRFLGLLERDRADEVPEVSRANSLVADLIEPDQGPLQVRDDTPLDSLLGNQNLRRLRRPDGGRCRRPALSGVITVEQVGRAYATPAKWLRQSFVTHRDTKDCRNQVTARWRSMMRAKSSAGGEGAEGLAPVAGEAGGAEGVGDGLVAVADQQRGLEGERHLLDHAAGADLDRLDVAGDLLAQGGGVGVEARLADRRPPRPRRRRPRARPGDLIVARRTSRHWTLPEPSQIELSGLSRKRRGIPDSST